MVAHLPNRRCDTCGEYAVCYADTALGYFDGWHCGRCTLARCAPDDLVHALDLLAGIASREPAVAKDFVLALREKAGSRLAKDAFSHTARNTAGQRDEAVGEMRDEWVARARVAEIRYEFPDDVNVAYEKGGEVGPVHDKDRPLPHPADIEWCEVYKPHKPRTFNAPDEQRWAVNHLRHGCSDYESVCTKLQREAISLLKRRGLQVDPDDECAIHEAIHRIVKNRVLADIAARYPELAEAAGEQTV